MNKKYILLCALTATTFSKATENNSISSNYNKEQIQTNNAVPNIIYVKKGSKGDGSSWENAMGELSQALKYANDNKLNYSDSNKLKIYVAIGTYIPQYSPKESKNNISTERDKTFLLVENIELYGGFDPENNIKNEHDKRILPNNKEGKLGTILSGDIDENDQIITNQDGTEIIINNEHNAYHVITNTNFNPTNTIIDGFTIKGGNSNGNDSYLYNSFIVMNNEGAAIYSSSPYSSTIDLKNTEISHNSGSVIYSLSTSNTSSINILNSNFKYNYGTTIYSNSTLNTTIQVINSIFVKNNLIDSNNNIIYSVSDKSNSNVKLINSNIISNQSSSIINFDNTVGSTTLNLFNSIVYNNKNDKGNLYNNTNDWISSNNNLTIDIRNSLIQGNSDLSNGNLASNLDPLFKDSLKNDYSLQDDSPLIDQGDNNLIPISIVKDLEGHNRIVGNIIDIGAFERNYILASDAIKSITRLDNNPTNSQSVKYLVEFNNDVTGVDINDFEIYKVSGEITGNITNISGSGKLYTVTLNNLSGEGEIRLDIKGKNTGIKNHDLVDLKGGYQDGEIYYIDTVAPEIPTINLHQNSDSGFRSNDRITNVTTPTFEGKSEPLSTISLYLNDNTTVLDSVITDSLGNWSYTANPLPEGKHKIIAIAKDAIGNISSPKEINLTIDITPPTRSGITIPSDRTYYFNENLNFRIVYNEEIHITNNANIELVISISGNDYSIIGETSDNKTFDFSFKVSEEMYDETGILIKGLRSKGIVQDYAGNVRVSNNNGSGEPTRIYLDGRNTDLVINSTVNKQNPKIGEQITLTINVKNEGKHDAKEVQIKAQIPKGLKIIGTNTTNGNFDSTTNDWNISLPTITKGNSETITINVEVEESKEFTINTIANSKTIDVNPSNNSSSVNLNSSKKAQAIIWNQELITGCDDSTPLQLQATSTSGLPITYTSSDESIIKIVNNQIIILKLGYAKVTAHLKGNNEFNEATSVTKDVTQKINGLVKKKFDDTLVFDNSSNNYIKWQWYKNGQKINGATGQFYNDPDKLNGNYYAEVTTTNGLVFETCPVQFGSNRAMLGIKSTPNPAKSGNNIDILSDYSESELKGAILIISDINGRKISEINNITKKTTIKTPMNNGTYIANLYLADGRKADTKILIN